MKSDLPSFFSRFKFIHSSFVTFVCTLGILAIGAGYGFYRSEIKPLVDEADIKQALMAAQSTAAEYKLARSKSFTGICRSRGFIEAYVEIDGKVYKDDSLCYDNPTTFALGATYKGKDGVRTFCVNDRGAVNELVGTASDLITTPGFGCK